MTPADPPSDSADANTALHPPADTVAADSPEQAYTELTTNDQVVLDALQQGLVTTLAVSRHTRLKDREVHQSFLHLDDCGLIVYEKPESWLAAQDDGRHRPVKAARLTTAGHHYFEWAESIQQPVVRAYTPSEKLSDFDQRLTTLERIVREEILDATESNGAS